MLNMTRWLGDTPEELRRYLQDDDDPYLGLRRGVVVASLAGIGVMALTSLLQTGVVKDLPDPPVGNFHTKKVNSSTEAYGYAGPDSPVTVVTHGLNMVLASRGGKDRAERQPWLPLLATFVAGSQAVVAAKYLFYQMPKVDRAWCPYCITDALTHFATVALTLPEAWRAVAGLFGSGSGRQGRPT